MAASLLMQRGKTDIAALSAFELSSCELQRVNFRGLNRPAMTAFFINIYNCLVLHSHLVRAKPVELKNKKERQAFSRATKYQIGEHVFSLQDIVEQVLLPKFVRHSEMPEQRIFFALSFGTASSPKMRVYRMDTLDQDLHYAAELCCAQMELRMDPKAVFLPKIFKWYREDLASDKLELLRLAFDYCPEELQRHLLTLMNASQTKIKFLKFKYELALPFCVEEILESLANPPP